MSREKTVIFLRFIAQNMEDTDRKENDIMAKKAVKAAKKAAVKKPVVKK
jgi:hypothetical protein